MNLRLLSMLVLVPLLISACNGLAASRPASSPPPADPQAAAVQPLHPAAPASADPAQSKRTPPEVAISACGGKAEKESCSFTDQNGAHTGACEMVQSLLACSPMHNAAGNSSEPAKTGNSKPGTPGPSGLADTPQPAGYTGVPTGGGRSSYNIDQAISDKAQGMTISFNALAFLTGDLGADSFFPPGKVADFWGFQYLRDNDPSQMGHAGEFLTSAADNMLSVLTAEQRVQLITLAKSQVGSIEEYGYRRFVLMQAFQNLVDGELPAGTTSLSEEAVKAYSAELYRLDGQISYERAQLYGSLLNSFTADQRAYLDSMKGKGMLEWPKVQEPSDLNGLDRPVKVAVMTYAGDMLSWYIGSVEADVYFCPERHGTYFGSFYLKDLKAMSDPTYAIPTNLTGDLGEQMLSKLNGEQALLITGLVDLQKPSLQGIVEVRQQVAIELRKFLAGETPNQATVLALMEHYGELDGEIIYNMAIHFSELRRSLSGDQKARLDAMRTELLDELSHPTGAYLYSQPISMPSIPSSDFLFK